MIPGRRHSRRAALALGGSVALGAALAACASGSAEEGTVPVTPEIVPRLATRWTGRPDGPLPATGDEGVPITAVTSGTDARPTLTGGVLVGNLPASHSACYLTQPLGAPVRRIGARVGFGPGDGTGSLALVAWNAGTPTVGHCHMVFGPDRWIAGVLEDGAVDEVARGSYPDQPRDLTPRTVDVVFTGDAAVLTLPDGTRTAVRDSRFVGGTGVVAVWEFYRHQDDSADVVLAQTWAG